MGSNGECRGYTFWAKIGTCWKETDMYEINEPDLIFEKMLKNKTEKIKLMSEIRISSVDGVITKSSGIEPRIIAISVAKKAITRLLKKVGSVS